MVSEIDLSEFESSLKARVVLDWEWDGWIEVRLVLGWREKGDKTDLVEDLHHQWGWDDLQIEMDEEILLNRYQQKVH